MNRPQFPGVLHEDYLREILTSLGDRFSHEEVDDMYKEAPIRTGGLFDYVEFTRILKHGAKDPDEWHPTQRPHPCPSKPQQLNTVWVLSSINPPIINPKLLHGIRFKYDQAPTPPHLKHIQMQLNIIQEVLKYFIDLFNKLK